MQHQASLQYLRQMSGECFFMGRVSLAPSTKLLASICTESSARFSYSLCMLAGCFRPLVTQGRFTFKHPSAQFSVFDGSMPRMECPLLIPALNWMMKSHSPSVLVLR